MKNVKEILSGCPSRSMRGTFISDKSFYNINKSCNNFAGNEQDDPFPFRVVLERDDKIVACISSEISEKTCSDRADKGSYRIFSDDEFGRAVHLMFIGEPLELFLFFEDRYVATESFHGTFFMTEKSGKEDSMKKIFKANPELTLTL